MFHSSLDEMVSTSGKSKAGAGGANSIANNFEFQRLQRDVSQELSSIKIGRNGKTGADRHPKMQKALELVNKFCLRFWSTNADVARCLHISLRRKRKKILWVRRITLELWYFALCDLV